MPRKSVTLAPEDFEARRAALKAELEALDRAEKEALAKLADAGREPLMAALARVKIPAMSRTEATALAKLIASKGGQLGNMA